MKFFHFTPVTIRATGDVVTFRDKLPGHAKKLLGIFLSADTHHATKGIANVGVNFNGGRNLMTNHLLRVPDSDPVRKAFPLDVNQPITENASINGYVEDIGAVTSFPYVVKVYYELSD